VAEQCERYDEMLVCMKKVVKMQPVLSLEEKNLLSVAYKNVVGARRAPWRTLAALEQKAVRDTAQLAIIRQMKDRMEVEIAEVVNDLLKLTIELIKNAADAESKVFYFKLQGDYHRYHVEVLPANATAAQATAAAEEAYKQATAIASAELPVCSPIRLGLALNFSVFLYEIRKAMEDGYEMAKGAFEAAIPKLDDLKDDDYRESATIMSLLRDNLNTWADALNIAPDKGDDMAMEDC